jgi:hypothetical protein
MSVAYVMGSHPEAFSAGIFSAKKCVSYSTDQLGPNLTGFRSDVCRHFDFVSTFISAVNQTLFKGSFYEGRSDRPLRHRFSLVFLCLQENAEMVPKIPSYYCVLLMQPSRFKLSKLVP